MDIHVRSRHSGSILSGFRISLYNGWFNTGFICTVDRNERALYPYCKQDGSLYRFFTLNINAYLYLLWNLSTMFISKQMLLHVVVSLHSYGACSNSFTILVRIFLFYLRTSLTALLYQAWIFTLTGKPEYCNCNQKVYNTVWSGLHTSTFLDIYYVFLYSFLYSSIILRVISIDLPHVKVTKRERHGCTQRRSSKKFQFSPGVNDDLHWQASLKSTILV